MRYLMPLALLFSVPVSADLLMNYNGFYGRMKKLQQPEYSDITLAFALTGQQTGQPCQFYSMKLVSDRHDMLLDMAGNGEISLPYDEALKDSNAVLQVLQADNVDVCQVQFRLRSRMRLSNDLTLTQLQHCRSQFDLLLDDMAGLGKYWLPDVSGVIIEFSHEATLPQMNGVSSRVTHCRDNRCYIRLDAALPADTSWLFSQRPANILPLIESRD